MKAGLNPDIQSIYEDVTIKDKPMKKSLVTLTTCSLLAALTLLVGCDWSSGSGDNNFNTRGLSSISNISGFYRGTLGGRAVSNTSRGNINNFTIQQSGNRIEVIDNQGSRYVGSVGNPLLLLPPETTTISDGAEVASYQISFTGRDGVAAKDIEFSGVITLVTVTDVQGETSTQTNTDNTTTTTTTTTTSSVPEQEGVDGVEPGVDETSTTTNENVDNNETTRTTGFSLTDANTQLRLRGTWKEIDGPTSAVDALGAGIVGNIGFTSAPAEGGGGEDTGGGTNSNAEN